MMGYEDGMTTGARLSFKRGEKVELRDLSWADRERVLRVLLAKINAENQATDMLRDVAATVTPGGQTPRARQQNQAHHQGLESSNPSDILLTSSREGYSNSGSLAVVPVRPHT